MTVHKSLHKFESSTDKLLYNLLSAIDKINNINLLNIFYHFKASDQYETTNSTNLSH